MSDYILKQKKKHMVKHVFSNQRHIFKVKSGDTRRDHDVIINASCTCEFFSVQGAAQSKICSHIVAVLERISQQGTVKVTSDKTLQMKRNECIKLVRLSNRKINKIRFGENEGTMHRDKKIKICMELYKQGKHFITEAIFENGYRADILVLDDFDVIEIVDSEGEESIKRKKDKYPEGLVIRIAEV